MGIGRQITTTATVTWGKPGAAPSYSSPKIFSFISLILKVLRKKKKTENCVRKETLNIFLPSFLFRYLSLGYL
jgi:hypothetical protein